MLINAQISNGLYVNEERNEFVIIKNDSVQFRYYNDNGFTTYTLGEGILEVKGKRKFIIRPSSSFLEKTSVMYRCQRNDNKLSIRVLSHDSLPIFGMWIKISQLQDKNKQTVNFSDIYGQWILDEKLIDYFCKKNVLIYAKLLGYTDIEKRTLLERGYDYIIKTRIPDRFSGVVVRDRKHRIVIHQLNEDEISIGVDSANKLKKVQNDYLFSCFPFDIDLKTTDIPVQNMNKR